MTTKFFLAALFILLFRYSGFSQFSEAYETLDVNNIEAGFSTNGSFFWDGDNAGYRVPKTGNASSIFNGGLWMGGIDPGGQLKLAAHTYRQNGVDYWPGPLDANASIDSFTKENWDKIWKVSKTQIEQHVADYNDNGVVNFPQAAIFEWPAKGNIYARGKNGVSLVVSKEAAPFFDSDLDGIYSPHHGDYPDIKGDEMLWYVFNDKGGIHTETGGQAIGVEIQISAYGYNCPDDDILYNTLFVDYKIISHTTIPILNFYIGKWIDFELGCFNNDYVGCDTLSNTFYAYNGTLTDPDCGTLGYGADPPVQTVTFLNAQMESFNYYKNDFTVTGNPANALHYYNYLSGWWLDNTPLTYGGNGYGGTVPAKFAFPGNPADTTGWSECAENLPPGDRRGVASMGPFTFIPGQTFEMTLAYSTHFLPYTLCPDFAPYRQRIDSLQYLFDNNLLQSCMQANFTCNDTQSLGCVWPGDADDNGIANMWDVFPIGIGYGAMDSTRPNATTDWVGQPMQDWQQNFSLIGTNYKHADCNGDGVIDTFDFQAILDNYGLVHFKIEMSQKSGIPLYLELRQGPLTAGSTVALDVFLGTSSLQIPDFYALAFSVFYNSSVVLPGSVTVDYTGSWAGTQGVDLAGIHKEFSSIGRVDVGFTRIDRNNTTGYGKVATLNYILIDDIAGKDGFQLETLSPWVSEAKAIRNDETEIELYLSSEAPAFEEKILIYPNPVENILNIEFPTSAKIRSLKIFDSIGKEVFSATSIEQPKFTVSTERFPLGIYFIEVIAEQGRAVCKFSVAK